MKEELLEDSTTLIVGLDDSNHAGKAHGEIILATFSFLHEDSIVTDFPNRRDYHRIQKWMDNPLRDYRFTILFDEKDRHSADNLSKNAPLLIENFLIENPLFNIKTLKIYLDGKLRYEEKQKLREAFSNVTNLENLVIDNFIKKRTEGDIKKGNKKRGFHKSPHCPMVIYAADVLANRLYSTQFKFLAEHNKYVINKQQLL